jgi:hypothetical protein
MPGEITTSNQSMGSFAFSAVVLEEARVIASQRKQNYLKPNLFFMLLTLYRVEFEDVVSHIIIDQSCKTVLVFYILIWMQSRDYAW